MAEQEGTDSATMTNSQTSDIESALAVLPPRDAKVLRLYFGLDDGNSRTLEEIGRIMGLSRERVLRPQSGRAMRALVVGTGFAGVHLTQEMRRADEGPESLVPIGFIDDDARLTGHQVEGVKVLGTIADLPRILSEQRVQMVVVSDADLPAPVVRRPWLQAAVSPLRRSHSHVRARVGECGCARVRARAWHACKQLASCSTGQ